jgi:DNA-directed RNA polymerase subunit RPC12/RpoP
MIKCPNCGSTAQPKQISIKFELDQDDNNMVDISRKYKCGCGKIFTTTQIYYAEQEEEVDDFDW